MISAGMSHSVAITKDGCLWSWGCNSSGELGDGTTTNANIPVKVMDDVVSVSAGSSHTLAVKKDGSLWSWGSNVSGELGNGSHDATSQQPVKQICAGDNGTGRQFAGVHHHRHPAGGIPNWYCLRHGRTLPDD